MFERLRHPSPADLVTAVRILCAFPMLFLPARSPGFFVLYLLGGLSDALDGTVARKTGKASPSGARFDTVADCVFVAVALCKTATAVEIPHWCRVCIAAVAAVKILSLVIGLIRDRRVVSVHSLCNKLCGAVLFAAPPVLLSGLPGALKTAYGLCACILAFVAALHELRMVLGGNALKP
ncbi:MAG: CDP-alcohol phosphatidyltransferase family protein [Clostridia bacterium]|nr:CDP-alcohol phosphatidyltransferase family protein [Clostridia bacterium]